MECMTSSALKNLGILRAGISWRGSINSDTSACSPAEPKPEEEEEEEDVKGEKDVVDKLFPPLPLIPPPMLNGLREREGAREDGPAREEEV